MCASPSTRSITLVWLALCLLLLGLGGAEASDLASPTGKTILVVSGDIETTNKDGTAEFDIAMLEALGTQSVETKTPWHSGSVKFEGVSLEKLMAVVGAEGDTVTAVALNEYTTEIPIADFADHGAILALKQDGEYMSVRDKGPLFIVYPFDSKAELQSQTYYSRSAWQLAKLVVD